MHPPVPLDANNLNTLFTTYGTTYQAALFPKISSQIRSALANASISDFYTNRQQLIAQTSAALSTLLTQNHVVFEAFQLGSIGIDSSINDRIIETQTNVQSTYTVANVRAQNLTRSDADNTVGNINQQMLTLSNVRKQAASVILQTADAKANGIRIESSGRAYALFQNVTSFNNTELIRYIYLKQLKTLPDKATLVVGFNNVAGLVSTL